MPRTIVDLPEPLLREVDALCRTLAISRAEAVRRALLAFVDQHHEVRADGFGLWRQGSDPAAVHERQR
jgi:metal-responsive CopG/Arc/MetJ family transcriptional regulator